MKQITIYDLLPLLRKGWVAMDVNGTWCWYSAKPRAYPFFTGCWGFRGKQILKIQKGFNIAPFDGDWKDSLMKCGIAQEKSDNDLTSDKLRQMMRDPKYWRDQDPQYVRMIENGFKKLYGNN